jgi:hypothetical protein
MVGQLYNCTWMPNLSCKISSSCEYWAMEFWIANILFCRSKGCCFFLNNHDIIIIILNMNELFNNFGTISFKNLGMPFQGNERCKKKTPSIYCTCEQKIWVGLSTALFWSLKLVKRLTCTISLKAFFVLTYLHLLWIYKISIRRGILAWA